MIFVTYGTLLLTFQKLESSVELLIKTDGYHKNFCNSRSYNGLKGTVTYFIQIHGIRVIWFL